MSSDATTLPLRGRLFGGTPPRLASEEGEGERSRAEGRAALIGAAALATILLGSVLIVLVSADRPTYPPTHAHFFPHWLAGPLGGLLPGFPRSAEALRYVFSLSLAAMYVAYLLALRYGGRLSVRWVIGAILAVHAIFFLSPPLALTDIFNYVNYARMEVVHHLNPYTTIPIYEPHSDPSFDLSNWHHLLSPYGPLFTLLTFAVVPLGVAASFWAFKAILAAFSLATIVLVWRCAELLGRDPLKAVVLVGLNPVVLVWGLGGDHNDFIMMLPVVLGFYLLVRAEKDPGAPRAPLELGAGAAFAAAVAVKASAGVLLPVVLAALARTPRRMARTALGMALGGAALALVSVIAFGLHLPDLSTQGRLVTALSPSNLLGLALGEGGESSGLRHALSLLLVAWIALMAVMAWRWRDSLTAAGWATVALFLTLSWVLPWYVLWVLPMAALTRSRALRATVLAFGVFFVLAWAPLTGRIFTSIGFQPEKTPLGKLHQRYVKELLN